LANLESRRWKINLRAAQTSRCPSGDTTNWEASAKPRSISTSEYEVSNHDHCEGQNGSRQNGEHAPVPKPGMRFRQPQHVNGKISLVEVVLVASVSGSVRHGKMLAMKAEHNRAYNVLLTIQNSTDKTQIWSGRKSTERPSAATSTGKAKYSKGECPTIRRAGRPWLSRQGSPGPVLPCPNECYTRISAASGGR